MKKIIIAICFSFAVVGCGQTDEVEKKEVQVIDLDVASMSSVMAYSTLENIMYNPQEYIGQTVRIQGTFYYEYYKELDMKFFAILLMDETDCCMAYAEIEMGEDIEYPKVGQEFLIIGEVKTKIVDGNEYSYVDVTQRVF